MLEEAHRQAAEDIEGSIADLGDPVAKPSNNRSAIECYWGAAFHWIAFGCQRKHGKHKENHSKLVSYLRDVGEPDLADLWNGLEQIRAGGWYGTHFAADDVNEAQRAWQEIRAWAHS